MCETQHANDGRWYVAIVRASCEKQVRDTLNSFEDGLQEAYVAVQLEMHKWSDRMKRIERIVLRNYVFFQYPDEREAKELAKKPPFRNIQLLTNVYGLLTAPGSREPAAIPDYQLQRFRKILEEANSKVEVVTNDKIQLGDHVQVIKGQFRGMDGYVSKTAAGKGKIYVAIDYLGFASMEIDPSFVRPLKEKSSTTI